jgi:hypothetical protein
MAKTTEYDNKAKDATDSALFERLPKDKVASFTKDDVQVIGKNIICRTDYRARKRSRFSIVVEATDGFIPLWEENRVLRWRFNANSLLPFAQPKAIAAAIRELLGEAIMAWGDAVPIRFTENSDNSDFEIVVVEFPDCTPQGCVLAQAFFPDAGRHQLLIFPTMFEQSREEQVETLAHEIGHIFGLRHFFAPDLETEWPAEIFGEHTPFSVMNYGEDSRLTEADRRDLKLLYEGAWSGQLKKINGTPIKLVRPYHYLFT